MSMSVTTGRRHIARQFAGIFLLVIGVARGVGAEDKEAKDLTAEDVFAEADRIVMAWIRTSDFTSGEMDRIDLGRNYAARRMSIHHVKACRLSRDESGALWVAGVTIWSGDDVTSGALRNSIRLYRLDPDGARRVATTDETPLIRLARARNSLAGNLYASTQASPGRSYLNRSLNASLESLHVWRSDKGDIVEAGYVSISGGCGAEARATVEWRVHDDRFIPEWAEYITETRNPWFATADLIMAVVWGKLPAEQVAGRATRDQLSILSQYGKADGEYTPDPVKLANNQYEVRCYAQKGDVPGWLKLVMTPDPNGWHLASFAFEPEIR